MKLSRVMLVCGPGPPDTTFTCFPISSLLLQAASCWHVAHHCCNIAVCIQQPVAATTCPRCSAGRDWLLKSKGNLPFGCPSHASSCRHTTAFELGAVCLQRACLVLAALLDVLVMQHTNSVTHAWHAVGPIFRQLAWPRQSSWPSLVLDTSSH